MWASIPGVLLILLWCIDAFDSFMSKVVADTMTVDSQQEQVSPWNKKPRIYILAILLLLGAATPYHEVMRTYTNTFSYYELQTISEEELYQGPNVCGTPDSFLGKYLAR